MVARHHGQCCRAAVPNGKRALSCLSLLQSIPAVACFFEASREIIHGESPIASVESMVPWVTSRPMQVKHGSNWRYSARWAPLTHVTLLASITSLSGEVQTAEAGTHVPRNFASALPPVTAWAVTPTSAVTGSNVEVIQMP
jgi:hypothetical protein